MKNHLKNLMFVLITATLVSACAPQTNENTQPAPTEVPDVIAPLPTEAVVAEPTLFDTTDQTIQTWTGVIESLPAGGQFNDQFTSNDQQPVVCGIDGNSDPINQLITLYRGNGKGVIIKGVLNEDVPDVNGCQILVTDLEGE